MSIPQDTRVGSTFKLRTEGKEDTNLPSLTMGKLASCIIMEWGFVSAMEEMDGEEGVITLSARPTGTCLRKESTVASIHFTFSIKYKKMDHKYIFKFT